MVVGRYFVEICVSEVHVLEDACDLVAGDGCVPECEYGARAYSGGIRSDLCGPLTVAEVQRSVLVSVPVSNATSSGGAVKGKRKSGENINARPKSCLFCGS